MSKRERERKRKPHVYHFGPCANPVLVLGQTAYWRAMPRYEVRHPLSDTPTCLLRAMCPTPVLVEAKPGELVYQEELLGYGIVLN